MFCQVSVQLSVSSGHCARTYNNNTFIRNMADNGWIRYAAAARDIVVLIWIYTSDFISSLMWPSNFSDISPITAKFLRSTASVTFIQRVITTQDVCRVRKNKISQRENRDIDIMQEYFCTKFSTFIYHICLYKSV